MLGAGNGKMRGALTSLSIIGIIVIIIIAAAVVVLLTHHNKNGAGAQTSVTTVSAVHSTTTPISNSSNSTLCTECLTLSQYSSLLGSGGNYGKPVSQSGGFIAANALKSSLAASGTASNPAFNQTENTNALWVSTYTLYNTTYLFPSSGSGAPLTGNVTASEMVRIINNAKYFYKTDYIYNASNSTKSYDNYTTGNIVNYSIYTKKSINKTYDGIEYTYLSFNSSYYLNNTLYKSNSTEFLGYNGNYLIQYTSDGRNTPESELLSYIAQNLNVS